MATFERKIKEKTNSSHIIEAYKAVDEAKKRIKKAKYVTDSFSEQMKNKGYVDELLVQDSVPTHIADGWFAYLISSEKTHNVFSVFARKGFILDLHVHDYELEIATVTEGKLKLLGPICSLSKKSIVGESDPPIFIPPKVYHGFEAIEDTRLIVIFRPPIRVVENE